MNETPDLLNPPPSVLLPESEPRPAEPRRALVAVLAVTVVVLIGSNAALWWRIEHVPVVSSVDPTPRIAMIAERLGRLEQASTATIDPARLTARLDALEQNPNRPAAEIDVAPLVARLDALNQRVNDDLAPMLPRLEALEQTRAVSPEGLRARVDALEQRRITDPVALQARIAAAEQKVAAETEATAARVGAIEASTISDVSAALGRITALEQKTQDYQQALVTRIAALEKRPVPDLAPIQAQVAALEQRPIADPRTPDRLDGLAGRLEGQTARTDTKVSEIVHRLESAEARLAKSETMAAEIAALADRASRLARLRRAEIALAAGQKLGPVPNAPPSLTRFADANPPTEAALRLAFPAVEQAVRAAHRPDGRDQPISRRVWNRVRDLVTVRQGDQVLIGDDVVGILTHAQAALDVGDLAGTVRWLSGLTGDAAKAAAHWLSDANALLEARSALATMAAAV